MNITRRDKRMNPRPLRELHRLPRRINVRLVASGEAADDRHVPILRDGVPDLAGDGPDGLEVVEGGGGESGLDDVDAEAGELAGDVELLLGGHGGAGRLLAVAEGGVEDADVGGVGNPVRDVLRPARVWGFEGALRRESGRGALEEEGDRGF